MKRKVVYAVALALFLALLSTSNASCGKVKRVVVQAPPDTVMVPHDCPEDD